MQADAVHAEKDDRLLKPQQTTTQLHHVCAGALTAALAWYRANHHAGAIAATRPRATPPARRIAAPTLGVYPSDDGALVEAQLARSGAHVAAGRWRCARLEGSGHWAQRDAGAALSRLLVDFCREGVRRGVMGGGGGGSGDGDDDSVFADGWEDPAAPPQSPLPRARL